MLGVLKLTSHYGPVGEMNKPYYYCKIPVYRIYFHFMIRILVIYFKLQTEWKFDHKTYVTFCRFTSLQHGTDDLSSVNKNENPSCVIKPICRHSSLRNLPNSEVRLGVITVGVLAVKFNDLPLLYHVKLAAPILTSVQQNIVRCKYFLNIFSIQ